MSGIGVRQDETFVKVPEQRLRTCSESAKGGPEGNNLSILDLSEATNPPLSQIFETQLRKFKLGGMGSS